MNQKLYSFRKSRTIFKVVYGWYKKKWKNLPSAQLKNLENEMSLLDDALLAGKKEDASEIAHRLEGFADTHCKKNFLEYVWELFIALVFALVIATFVRQMWFELYEIPTGSMRPTFREQDHLTVTKTVFGINFPLETRHLYFDAALVQRGSILIFSGDGLPLPDVDTTYFGIFPYKKRYIKRLIGKPGDSLYFYGGQLFGVDKEGHELTELRETAWMKNLEYVPILSFEGQIVQSKEQSIIFQLFNKSVGKIALSAKGQLNAEIFNGKTWVKDQPLAQIRSHSTIETYSDLYGIRNYALARLLNKEQLSLLKEPISDLEDAPLYLHLHHTPSLAYPNPIIFTPNGARISVTGYSTLIPLQERHLNVIMDNLYTARFVVKDERAKRYELGNATFSAGSPLFPGVPNGTYEFYSGKASSIHWAGISSAVPKEDPLYSHKAENIQKLFNLGIEMNNYFSPEQGIEAAFPHRYAYFREGTLYLMGVPVIRKEDETLLKFEKREEEKQAKASLSKPYVAFKDYGPPLKEGKINAEFIKNFGITVPEKEYLVLGDNHAMSSDSRVFGFVPEANLQGAPCWIIWPPGDRLGAPPQKPYPFMNIPRAVVWSVVALICALWYAYHRWKISKPIFVKKSVSQ
jgi:signal peptidase I